MGWLVTQGAKLFLPFGHSPDVDPVADFGDELLRVQVKTSTVWRNARCRRWLGILVGGPKYAAYEMESDVPLKVLAANRIARLPDLRRGSRAVKGVWL